MSEDMSEFREAFLTEAQEHLQAMDKALLVLERSPSDAETLNEVFRAIHTLKGVAATLGYDRITALTHELESVLDLLRNGEMKADAAIIKILFDGYDLLETLIDEVATGAQYGADPAGLIERLKTLLGERRTSEPPVMLAAPPAGPVAHGKDDPGGAVAAPRRIVRIKVDIERLDNLINLISELVIGKARLAEIAKVYQVPALVENLGQIDRICFDLQEEVLKTRLVPVSHIFERYPRMVRDLAKRSGKDVLFEVSGSEIEIDRTLVEQINDILGHLLRNAVDHGLENSEKRGKSGKNMQGVVRLAARRERGFALIQVSDDGRGVDPEKVLARAAKIGVALNANAATMSDSDLLDVLCLPGFSTAEQVTDISGRGVGLDAVRARVESLNGRLEMHTVKGQGTTFKIYLPLSLAIIQALLIRLGRETYALPLSSVGEIVAIEPHEVFRVGRRTVTRVRGRTLPLLDLRETFGVKGGEKTNDLRCKVVVTELGDRSLGLIVDDLVGRREIVVKTLTGMTRTRAFSSATILGDGRVVPIIDVTIFFENKDRESSERAAAGGSIGA